jgi:hypothetical protein
MSVEPRKDLTKFAPQLLGILVLAAILMAGGRSDSPPRAAESPLQQASRRLRVGMTANEAREVTHDVRPLHAALAGSSHSYLAVYFDPKHKEWLFLSFADKGDLRDEMRLINWDLHR